MSVEEISSAISDAAIAARAAYSASPSRNRARWSLIPPSVTDRVAAALRRDPELLQLEGKIFHSFQGSARLDFTNVAVYLVDRAVDAAKPVEIAADVLRIARGGAIHIRRIHALAGVSVDSPVDLGHGIKIVPPTAIAEYPPAHQIFRSENLAGYENGTPPTCAITVDTVFDLKWSDENLMPIDPSIAAAAAEHNALVERVRTAVLLGTRGVPQLREEFTVFYDPGWYHLDIASWGGARPFPVRLPWAQPIDTKVVGDALTGLAAHKRPDQIALASSKLEASRTRGSADERAIDLGTCIEVILMHGEKSTGEIRHKIATRAAWLAGANSSERLEIFRLAQGLYDMRSKAVHEGRLPERELQSLDEIQKRFSAYDRLCVRLILALVKRGDWPDWTPLVLGAATATR